MADEEFAAWVEPDPDIFHRQRDNGRIWHRCRMKGRSAYILSKSADVPNGVYVLKRYKSSLIHFEIVSEDKKDLPLPGPLLPA